MKKSSDYKYDTLEYYRLRVKELETDRDTAGKEAKYYREQLSKSHEILGRTIHQLSQRWDSVILTEYFPTDNLGGQRTLKNPEGK